VGAETKGRCGHNLRSWQEFPPGNVDWRLVNGARAWIDQSCSTGSPRRAWHAE
jgi:hypothetical protein